MKSDKLREKFIDFFKQNGHKHLKSSPLLVEDDSSVLFTTAGMQQFKDWYISPKKAEHSRVVTIQKCFRTSDIDEVGDNIHHTFFEMAGSFSFGWPQKDSSYFKKEAVKLAWEFLTDKKWLGIEKEKIWATVFKGDGEVDKDIESKKILKDLGVKEIEEEPRQENFWGPVGETGPCGPTVEFFVEGKEEEEIELWNLVFNEYFKKEDGSLKKLEAQGVDTGMGLERVLAYLNDKRSDYGTDLFKPLLDVLKKDMDIEKNKETARIIVDHIKGSVFLMSEGLKPSNVSQAYILRRLLRRVFSLAQVHNVGLKRVLEIKDKVIEINDYFDFDKSSRWMANVIKEEFEKYRKTIDEGMKEYKKIGEEHPSRLPGKLAFKLHDTHGLPKEVIKDLAKEHNQKFGKKEKEEYKKAEEEHKKASRASKKRFKGGLADHKKKTIKLHTAAHLLHQALRKILGRHVKQAGQNITQERLRFDFTYPKALTDEEIEKIEDLVNKKIEEDLKVEKEEMDRDKALNSGASALFKGKYPDRVTVYSIGDFSKELCLGPHIRRTGELGKFKIKKEESSSKGVRRIRAVLE